MLPGFRFLDYVEKKICGRAVRPARSAGNLWTIGAGLAETGFILESLMRSCSILRCSCGWGRLGDVMVLLSHEPEASSRKHRRQRIAIAFV